MLEYLFFIQMLLQEYFQFVKIYWSIYLFILSLFLNFEQYISIKSFKRTKSVQKGVSVLYVWVEALNNEKTAWGDQEGIGSTECGVFSSLRSC